MIWRNIYYGKLRHAWIQLKWSDGWRPLCGLVTYQNTKDLQKSETKKCKRCLAQARTWEYKDEEEE